MFVGGYKTADQNHLKLGTVLVHDTMSEPADCGFKRSRVRVRVGVVACREKIMLECGGCYAIQFLMKNSPPDLHKALSNEYV